MLKRGTRTRLAAAAILGAGLSLAACGPSPAAVLPSALSRPIALLPDVRLAKDRPPVVLVVRDGDPSGAVALAVTTSGLEGADDDPEAAVALAGMVEARLVARGLAPVVVPSWSGFRAGVLVATQ